MEMSLDLEICFDINKNPINKGVFEGQMFKECPVAHYLAWAELVKDDK